MYFHKKPIGFAYPGGGPWDFGGIDYDTLREAGVKYAACTRAGFCDVNSDWFTLPRVSVGQAHSAEKFALEISGLVDRRRQKEDCWL